MLVYFTTKRCPQTITKRIAAFKNRLLQYIGVLVVDLLFPFYLLSSTMTFFICLLYCCCLFSTKEPSLIFLRHLKVALLLIFVSSKTAPSHSNDTGKLLKANAMALLVRLLLSVAFNMFEKSLCMLLLYFYYLDICDVFTISPGIFSLLVVISFVTIRVVV
jgi:signal transduction histidine kinase